MRWQIRHFDPRAATAVARAIRKDEWLRQAGDSDEGNANPRLIVLPVAFLDLALLPEMKRLERADFLPILDVFGPFHMRGDANLLLTVGSLRRKWCIGWQAELRLPGSDPRALPGGAAPPLGRGAR